jgi:hypothetical protein
LIPPHPLAKKPASTGVYTVNSKELLADITTNHCDGHERSSQGCDAA